MKHQPIQRWLVERRLKGGALLVRERSTNEVIGQLLQLRARGGAGKVNGHYLATRPDGRELEFSSRFDACWWLMQLFDTRSNGQENLSTPTGAHDWPLVQSTVFPSELTLACPKCGSRNILMTVAYGPGGRLGDPGATDIIRCEDCKHADYKPAKPMTRY